MSLMGQSRHIQRTPKTNLVRYAPNSDHSTAEFVCPLSANRDRQRACDPKPKEVANCGGLPT
jgi:hypothetical protein